MEDIFEFAERIVKAQGYDILREEVVKLKAENESLKKDCESWKNIALGYRGIFAELKKILSTLTQ